MENRILKFILATIAVVAASLGVFFVMTTTVPVLKNSVEAGDVIVPDNIVEKRIAKSALNGDEILSTVYVVNKEAVYSIEANTPIRENELKAVDDPGDLDNAEMAIVPLAVGEAHLPTDLEVGDLINVIAYISASQAKDVANDIPAFVIGFKEIGTVVAINKTSDGNYKVDVKMSKSQASDLIAATSFGSVYIVRNYALNDVDILGTTLKDVYMQNFTVAVPVIEDVAEVE